MSTTNGSTNGINRVAQVVPTTQQEQMAALAAMMQQMQQKLAQQEAAAAALKAENEKLKAGTPTASHYTPKKHEITVAELAEHSKALIGSTADPKTFSTGNTGFHTSGKVTIDGIRYQASVMFCRIKS